MEKNEIKGILIQSIIQIQQNSGRSVREINDNFYPLHDLDGFDSLNALEVCVLIATEIQGCDPDITFFYSQKERRPLCIEEIATALYEQQKGATDEKRRRK